LYEEEVGLLFYVKTVGFIAAINTFSRPAEYVKLKTLDLADKLGLHESEVCMSTFV
jgi:hypothetical protein